MKLVDNKNYMSKIIGVKSERVFAFCEKGGIYGKETNIIRRKHRGISKT